MKHRRGSKSSSKEQRGTSTNQLVIQEEEVPSLRVTQTVSVPLKYVCLLILVGQTSALVLLMRHSRAAQKDSVPYLASTAVVCAEVIKLFMCFAILLKSKSFDVSKVMADVIDESIYNWKEAIKLAVPAGLYTIQNNLLYVALSNLDSATYQVTYQLKILTTALFSVGMLGKQLGRRQWLSLVILMAGVCLVQWPTPSHDAKEVETQSASSRLVGLSAVLLSCISSGFSGVYFEKLLKSSQVFIGMRNIQLAFFSIFLGVIAVFVNDWSLVRQGGFFQGYDVIAWMVIALQACGGLLVAVVVKYADNILKGFATSISIVLSSLLAYFFLGDFTPTWSFLVGASAVLFATYLYSFPSAATQQPSSKR